MKKIGACADRQSARWLLTGLVRRSAGGRPKLSGRNDLQSGRPGRGLALYSDIRLFRGQFPGARFVG